MITQEQLKEHAQYDPETGVFTCVKATANRRLGAILGSIDPKGYLRFRVLGERNYAHRLAWLYEYGEFPADQIDHINGVVSDNRISNLRAVSSGGNSRNSKRRIQNKTGVNGVSYCAQNLCFIARISFNCKDIYIGRFDTIFEAVCARKSAEIALGYHPNHGRDPS